MLTWSTWELRPFLIQTIHHVQSGGSEVDGKEDAEMKHHHTFASLPPLFGLYLRASPWPQNLKPSSPPLLRNLSTTFT